MPSFCQKNRLFSLTHPMHWVGLALALVALWALPLQGAIAGYGLRFIEIYRRDVISLPDVIRYAHEVYTK